MPEARDIQSVVFVGSAPIFLARITNYNSAILRRDDVAAVEYTAYLLDNTDLTSRSAIEGHTGVSLLREDVIFDELQSDYLWSVDKIGYNFRHYPDISNAPLFSLPARHYLIEYRIAPVLYPTIIVRFRCLTI